MSAKILIGHPLKPETINRLSEHFEVHCISEKKQKYDQIINVIENYDALLAMGHRVDNTLIDKGKRLKIISNFGVGYDNIDVEYAQEKGVVVANAPYTTAAPTANYTIGLMLALLHKIVLCDRWLRQEALPNWGDRKMLGTSPEGKVLGIIGMGRIGKAVAERALLFGLDIWYHNRNPLPRAMEKRYQAKYVALPKLLKEADIISIHTPLTKSTQQLIGAKELSLMKPTAYLINTSRGEVIDQDALIHMLQEKKIAGAALDVFANEPHIPKELFEFENVILSPHNATGTKEDRRKMFVESFGNIEAFFMGKELSSRVV